MCQALLLYKYPTRLYHSRNWNPSGKKAIYKKTVIMSTAKMYALSCKTLCDPMDYSPARLLCPRNSPVKSTRADCHTLLQGIFPTQRWNTSLLHCRQSLYHLSPQSRYSQYTHIIQLSIHILWYLPKGVENLCPQKNLQWMLTVALLMIVKAWREPRCPSAGEWINKLWYI